jgi:hypothetical protein
LKDIGVSICRLRADIHDLRSQPHSRGTEQCWWITANKS